MEVNVTPQDAKVAINSRTGSVVMNREVTLDSCAVAQGNLSVTVNRQRSTSTSRIRHWRRADRGDATDSNRFASERRSQSVRSSANLNSVVRALNALGATPMDLMSILQSMQSAGCLRAKLEIIWMTECGKLPHSAAWDAQSRNELKAKAGCIRRRISVPASGGRMPCR